MKAKDVERLELGKGRIGFLAADPGDPPWTLWTVRWPAHECYTTSEGPHCAEGSAPQTFRSGKAKDLEAARAAIDDALRAGRPTRDTTARQFRT